MSTHRSLSLTIYIAALALSQPVFSQSKVESSLCNHENAVEIIHQQIDATKTFDQTRERIKVLVRAADLLWSYRQQKARAAFVEAFELATLDYKSKGDSLKREGTAVSVSLPDQRYIVIAAIARKDLNWATRLTEQLLKEESKRAEEAAAGASSSKDIATAANLLDAAAFLLPSNVNAAT